jgi:hypothetical protein
MQQSLFEPLLNRVCNKLRAVIAAYMLRNAVDGITCNSVSKTCLDWIWRSTRMTKHWRVYSSSIVSILRVLPLSVRSKIKSQVQTWLG